MQVLNVLLYRINKFSPVLLYRTTNLNEYRSAERSQQAKKARTLGLTKSAENPKHLIRTARRAKSIPEPWNNLVLDPRHTLVVRVFSCYPYLSALCVKYPHEPLKREGEKKGTNQH